MAVKTPRVQVGISSDPNKNFVIDASQADNTLKISRGSIGNTSQEVITVDSNGNLGNLGLPAFQCRAWVVFNGLTGAVIQQGNVSNVVRNAQGVYTITFTTPMPHANYAFGGGVSNTVGTAPFTVCQTTSNTLKTTNSLGISTAFMNGTVATNGDCTSVSVYVFC